jgi:FkbM family methyltransferase
MTEADRPVLRDLGVFVPRRPHRLTGPLLTMLLNGLQDRHQGRVFVLQVGAGDGHGAPGLLPRFQTQGWSGLLIEPHPRLFAALESLHAASDRVAVLNLGLSDVSATLPLYALKPEARQRHQAAALNRASLIRDRLLGPGVTEADLDAVEVPFLRLDAVLGELGIDSVQFLVVNVGGHEEQVLRGSDLAALAPSLVLVRSTAGTPADAGSLAVLEGAGLLPFRLGDWLAGLAPGHLAVPIEELLSFFGRGVGQPEIPE